ncbi:MAG: alanyl-tRNA synthetase [Ginsengibacter sp.]
MTTEKNKKPLVTWIKRIGFWGFLFFLIKGLVWLAVGYFIMK